MTAVAELTGADLALWVARAIKLRTPGDRKLYAAGPCLYLETQWGGGEPFAFRPDSDWSAGGPLLDQYNIVVERVVTAGGATLHYPARKYPHQITGPTYLIAAMRALVASVYGDTVPDEVKL